MIIFRENHVIYFLYEFVDCQNYERDKYILVVTHSAFMSALICVTGGLKIP